VDPSISVQRQSSGQSLSDLHAMTQIELVSERLQQMFVWHWVRSPHASPSCSVPAAAVIAARLCAVLDDVG
jgi:hypothetical protein